MGAGSRPYPSAFAAAVQDALAQPLASTPVPVLSYGMRAKVDSIVLSGRGLTPATIVEIARAGRGVALDPAALTRMGEGRQVIEAALDSGAPVYGLTTGLGARATQSLPREVLEEFSRLTLRGRSHALGPPLPRAAVRAAMVVRLNGLLLGGAGASSRVVEALANALNASLTPVVPAFGSIGAGDLCLLAHIGLALIGEGEMDLGGTAMPAAKALEKAGLKALELGPKDGLATCNASSVSAGIGALALHDVSEVWDLANIAAALSYEGFRANVSSLDERLARLRPQPGQAETATAMRALLEGGDLFTPGAARRVQDPLSLRCVAQVHGALRATLDFTAPALDAEVNGDSSNPAVLIEDKEVLSTGNFHTPLLAIAFDSISRACAQVAHLGLARMSKLLLERLSDLPANLSPRGSTRSGLAPVMKPAEALVAEIEHQAQPVRGGLSLSADGVEDHMTHAPQAVQKLGKIAEPMRLLIAAELMVAAQAAEMRGGIRLGPRMRHVLQEVRARVAPLDDDRPLSGDIARLETELLATGLLSRDVNRL